ncbi:uncharacterized protein LOC131855124 [Achroia grisella]|uniref:uncharacterized protein LOC131855124 n=1 Tax=Achroia grisella TaxID=688607 RepID=UPI0027D257E7|nr:uncharacterized protein LOC131855124 [Achroia grisella]
MHVVAISFLVIYSTNIIIQSLPINNGFSVKFNPISVQEEVKPKIFGALFAKISQVLTPKAALRREILAKTHSPHLPDLGTGCSNQIVKIIFPHKGEDGNYIQERVNTNFLNLPIIKQPFDTYKILIATAPPNVKMGGDDDKPMVIYIVFPEDGTDSINIPTIYFVNNNNEKLYNDSKTSVDPIIIIDSNRTVTGLKSKEIQKYVKFKNKLANHYKYKITQ